MKFSFLNVASILLMPVFATAANAQSASNPPSEPPAPARAADAEKPVYDEKGWLVSPSAQKPVPTPSKMSDEELALVEKANQRWQALAKKDYASAYALLTPGSRTFKSVDAFSKEAAASSFQTALATRAECESAGRCVVHLTAQAQLSAGRAGTLTVPLAIQEIWLKSADGTFGLLYQ